jgi:hypothetical protein
MTLGSFEVVFYTLAFIVPGFIGYSVLSALVPMRGVSTELSLLRFLTFSCFNYAIWAGPLYWAVTQGWYAQHPGIAAVGWAVIVLISPAGIAVGLAALQQRQSVLRLLRLGGIESLHSIPTSWDFIFTRGVRYWLLITLIDDTRIGGYWGSRSFASSEPGERDVYLEQAYRVSSSGAWERLPRDAGVWIRGADIRLIEFREEEDQSG